MYEWVAEVLQQSHSSEAVDLDGFYYDPAYDKNTLYAFSAADHKDGTERDIGFCEFILHNGCGVYADGSGREAALATLYNGGSLEDAIWTAAMLDSATDTEVVVYDTHAQVFQFLS